MEKLKFSIQSLLSKNESNKITGPMSPMAFAEEIMNQMQQKFNRLARIWFEDDEIFQCREDQGFTGYDILLIGAKYKNDLWLSLWVDKGIGGLPVAMAYQSDQEIIIAPVYQDTTGIKKISYQQIKDLFEEVFNHPEKIAVIAN